MNFFDGHFRADRFIFLYLTISTIDKFPGEMAKQATSKMSQYPNGPFAIDLAYIGDLVAILGLLIGGLLVANKLGITGAKIAMGLRRKGRLREWARA